MKGIIFYRRQYGGGMLLALLIVLAMLVGHEIPALSLFGRTALLSVAALSLFWAFGHLSFSGKIHVCVFRIGLPLLLLSFLYAFSALWSGGGVTVRGVQILSVMAVLHLFFILSCKAHAGHATGRLVLMGGLSSLLVAGLVVVFYPTFGGLGFLNDNSVGMWVATLLFVGVGLFRTRLTVAIYVGLMLTAIYITGSRASLGAAIGGLSVYILWPIISERKIFFWLILMSIALFSVMVIVILGGGIFDLAEANTHVRDLTGKNLLSGREGLWSSAIDLIYQKPWFGWGGSATMSTVSYFNHSAHNFYLQILLQVGAVGLLFVIALAAVIWREVWIAREGVHVRAAASALVVMLLCQSFEITMLQNNMALSFPVWAFLGAALGDAWGRRRGVQARPQ